MQQLSKQAQDAIDLINLIRRNPAPQSKKAEQKVLGRLSVQEYLEVIKIVGGAQ